MDRKTRTAPCMPVSTVPGSRTWAPRQTGRGEARDACWRTRRHIFGPSPRVIEGAQRAGTDQAIPDCVVDGCGDVSEGGHALRAPRDRPGRV